MPARERGLRFFARLQDIVLLAWLAFVTMLPENLYGLVTLVMLLPVWGLAAAVGLWALFKIPTKRLLATWVMAAFPVTCICAMTLSTLFDLPLTDSDVGGWVYIGVFLAYPVYWLGRWLLRATKPLSATAPRQPASPAPPTNQPAFKSQPNPVVRRRLTDTIFFAVFGMLMLQSLLLVAIVPFGDYFSSFKRLFGGEWYTNLLFLTLGTTVVLSIVAVPYAILRLIRGTAHKAAMIAVLVFIGVTITCTFGLLAFFAMLAGG